MERHVLRQQSTTLDGLQSGGRGTGLWQIGRLLCAGVVAAEAVEIATFVDADGQTTGLPGAVLQRDFAVFMLRELLPKSGRLQPVRRVPV